MQIIVDAENLADSEIARLRVLEASLWGQIKAVWTTSGGRVALIATGVAGLVVGHLL